MSVADGGGSSSGDGGGSAQQNFQLLQQQMYQLQHEQMRQLQQQHRHIQQQQLQHEQQQLQQQQHIQQQQLPDFGGTISPVNANSLGDGGGGIQLNTASGQPIFRSDLPAASASVASAHGGGGQGSSAFGGFDGRSGGRGGSSSSEILAGGVESMRQFSRARASAGLDASLLDDRPLSNSSNGDLPDGF
jgi:hypothetical protein